MDTNHGTRFGDLNPAGCGRRRGGRARGIAVALIAASALAGTAAAAGSRTVMAAAPGVTLPMPPALQALPGLPPLSAPQLPLVPASGGDTSGGGSAIQPHPVPFCQEASVDCVAVAADRLRAQRDRLGCDHGAVFASAYMDVTQNLLEAMRGDPHFFQDPVWLTYLDVHFVNAYLRQADDYDAGRPVSEAWQMAFDTARTGEVYAGQDLLLGLNAHIQSDLPFVLADMGLRTPAGETRLQDFRRINDLFQGVYPRIIQGLTQRYDPLVGISNPGLAYDTGAAQVQFTQWRDQAWRNAERLIAARTPAERDGVAASITANALTWARSFVAAQVPGYRAQRDAYCQTHASGA